jgi:hypothetical protein
MKNVVNRLIPCLARSEPPPKGKMEPEANTEDHKDHDSVIYVMKLPVLLKETQPGVNSMEEKVELWRYNSNLVFEPGETLVSHNTLHWNTDEAHSLFLQDMDLLSENRSLIHTGKFLHRPDTGFKWGSWCELFVLLFDNCCK